MALRGLRFHVNLLGCGWPRGDFLLRDALARGWHVVLGRPAGQPLLPSCPGLAASGAASGALVSTLTNPCAPTRARVRLRPDLRTCLVRCDEAAPGATPTAERDSVTDAGSASQRATPERVPSAAHPYPPMPRSAWPLDLYVCSHVRRVRGVCHVACPPNSASEPAEGTDERLQNLGCSMVCDQQSPCRGSTSWPGVGGMYI